MAVLSEADQKFVNLVQNLIVKYNLGIDQRVGLFYAFHNIGDVYFFSASVSYAQSLLNKHYVVITYQNCPVDIFLNWQNANGANIEKHCIADDEYEIIYQASDAVKESYQGVLDFFWLGYEDIMMSNHTIRDDVYQHLTRPKIKKIDRQKYIEHFGLVPGKTVFMIPESNWMGTLPLYFWIMSIQLFRLLGYHVLVNSKNKIYGDDVVYCYPHLDDVVDLCNVCGTVYAIRVGLSEVIASETTAKMFIFSVQPNNPKTNLRSVLLMYPFIDNSDQHLVEIPIPENKEYFSWIKNAQETFAQLVDPLYFNLKIRDRLQDIFAPQASATASLLSYDRVFNIPIFQDFSAHRCDHFCRVEYNFYTQKDLIYLSMTIKPYGQYIIHLALKADPTDEIVQTYYHYNYHNVIFQPKDDNDYYVVVHIINPETRQNAVFATHSLTYHVLPKYKLALCTEYNQYLKQLRALLQEKLVVFIVYKDLHLSEQTEKYHWLTLIDHGKTIHNKVNLEQTTGIEYQWDMNLASISSSVLHINEKKIESVSIRINGDETVVDHQGFNFVVWDKEDNKLLDSVCFDIFLDAVEAYRL